jgi:hypothetical protein
MSRTVVTALSCVLSFGLVHPVAYASEEVDEARAAALQWLSHVDAGDYDSSWSDAAELFRSEVSPEMWRTAATNVRSPLGDLVVRTYRSARHATRLPGYPQGDYFVIVYISRFADRPDAEETVTMMNDDGQWRMVSYFVR